MVLGKGIEWAYDKEIFGSFFPICRLSSSAIDFLYQKRIERFAQYTKLENQENFMWLFGEVFVPSELAKNGYSISSIEEKYISHINWDKEFDLNDRLYENPDNLLYHPIKGQFLARIDKLKQENEYLQHEIENLRKKQNAHIWQKFFSIKREHYHNKNKMIITLLGIKIKM